MVVGINFLVTCDNFGSGRTVLFTIFFYVGVGKLSFWREPTHVSCSFDLWSYSVQLDAGYVSSVNYGVNRYQVMYQNPKSGKIWWLMNPTITRSPQITGNHLAHAQDTDSYHFGTWNLVSLFRIWPFGVSVCLLLQPLYRLLTKIYRPSHQNTQCTHIYYWRDLTTRSPSENQHAIQNHPILRDVDVSRIERGTKRNQTFKVTTIPGTDKPKSPASENDNNPPMITVIRLD